MIMTHFVFTNTNTTIEFEPKEEKNKSWVKCKQKSSFISIKHTLYFRLFLLLRELLHWKFAFGDQGLLWNQMKKDFLKNKKQMTYKFFKHNHNDNKQDNKILNYLRVGHNLLTLHLCLIYRVSTCRRNHYFWNLSNKFSNCLEPLRKCLAAKILELTYC